MMNWQKLFCNIIHHLFGDKYGLRGMCLYTIGVGDVLGSLVSGIFMIDVCVQSFMIYGKF